MFFFALLKLAFNFLLYLAFNTLKYSKQVFILKRLPFPHLKPHVDDDGEAVMKRNRKAEKNKK
jgi:hypothetical protein